MMRVPTADRCWIITEHLYKLWQIRYYYIVHHQINQAFPCFSKPARKVGKAWSIWWCNDDISATISATVCINGGRCVIITSPNQPGLPYLSRVRALKNMGKPGYEAINLILSFTEKSAIPLVNWSGIFLCQKQEHGHIQVHIVHV